MKAKQRLGAVLRKARGEAGMTQRELAAQLGVKASHIAYLESGQRRPSMALLQKLGHVFDLDAATLLTLAFPESREMLAPLRGGPARKSDAWQVFIAQKSKVRRYGITSQEMRLLRAIHRARPISAPEHFVFLLLAMRQAWEA